MRKALIAVLVGAGVFCLVLAGMLRFWAPGAAKKTPLNLDIKLVATGPSKLQNASGDLADAELRATRRVRTDSAASNSKVTVVQETLCIVKVVGDTPECLDAQDPQGRLVSFTTDRVAADRKTADSVNDPKYHENVNGDTNIKHVGVSYKFPFDTKKQTYNFFDPAAGRAADAKYISTEKIAGVKCYKFDATIDNLDLDVAPGVPGKYTDTRTVWVDPVTGVIVKGVEHQIRTLTNGSTALETTLTFDDASIAYQAKQAKDGHSKITMLTVILPLATLVLGLLAFVGAWFMSRRSPQLPDANTGSANVAQTVPRS